MSNHNHPSGDHVVGRSDDELLQGVLSYVIGLAFAATLTVISFAVAIQTETLWQPGVTIGLAVLAFAQMGVHLVFFLHLTTSPDSENNVLAVAFGVLIILIVGVGSIWIMNNLEANMAPVDDVINLQQMQ